MANKKRIRTEYHKQYYKNNKMAYAYSKRLQYWKGILKNLLERLNVTENIEIMSLGEIQERVKELREVCEMFNL